MGKTNLQMAFIKIHFLLSLCRFCEFPHFQIIYGFLMPQQILATCWVEIFRNSLFVPSDIEAPGFD